MSEEPFKVLIFVGSNQARIDINIATAIQALGSRGEYVRVTAAGRNALDFHIAYYLGRLAVAEPESYFHIISVDKGYDPLIEHLKLKGVHATRCAGLGDIPIVKASGAVTTDEKLSIIIAYLVKRGAQRPASRKTLATTAAALFKPKLADSEVQALLDELERNGVFMEQGTRIEYSFPH